MAGAGFVLSVRASLSFYLWEAVKPKYVDQSVRYPCRCCARNAGLLREHHDEVARFMAAMQPEGAAQASQLSGLSLQAGLALAMQRRQFSECAACLPAPRLYGATAG